MNNKTIIYIVIIVLIIIGGYMVYGNKPSDNIIENTPTPNTPTPAPLTEAGPGEHCGGNMTTALSCTTGYHCAPTPGSTLPFGDVGGTCVAD